MTVVDTNPTPALSWAQEPDISARSTLVTILGDTVAPLGGTVWLSQLIALTEPFGFSDRLVRTSLFRLAAEGWVSNERVGRQSRYSLTDYGRRETEAAEQRIYRRPSGDWDGWWTLVFLAPDGADSDAATRHLRWRGFARLADGVQARPGDHTAETRKLLDSIATTAPTTPGPPVATARFDDGAPVAGDAFRHDSGLVDAEEAYHRFLDRYDPVDLDELTPMQAFTLRTRIVHDLRRARLQDPDLPAELLPTDWVGHRAIELAATIHRVVAEPAWRWVEELTGLTVDLTAVPLSARFPQETTP